MINKMQIKNRVFGYVANLLIPKEESPKMPTMHKNFAFLPKKRRDKSKFELKQGLHGHFLLLI